MGGLGGLGFLGDSGTTSTGAINLVCGVTKKRKNQGPETTERKKRPTRPVISMILHTGKNRHLVKALLDTGCSLPLINLQTVKKLGIQCKPHKNPRTIENYTGTKVEGAGQYYTDPMHLQHRNHYTNGQFEASPMEAAIDLFLPFEWIQQHPPQRAWTNKEIRFNSARCLDECTKLGSAPFSLTWDESILYDEEAWLIGYVLAIKETEDPLASVPVEFRQYLGIMGKEAADVLPEHRPYDCKIDLKEGTTAPWGPIYPLSEIELQTLREWLKEMEKTGKIRRSTSPAGSPILFVPKPNG